MTMVDRVVVLEDDRVEQIGQPLDLYDRPANRFAAGFVGSPAMNFTTGTLRQDDSGWFFDCSATRLDIASVSGGKQGQSAVFGIRPEHLDVVPHGWGIEAEVEVVEPTGASTFVFTQIAGTPVCAALNDRSLTRPSEQIDLVPILLQNS